MSLTIEERIERILGLDLEPIVFKLITPDGEESAKMTRDQADNAVSLYRQFLILHLLYPSKHFSPTRLIDQVWHAHILDTSKYRVDCDNIFDHFFDHHPSYLHLRGPGEAARLQEAFAETRQLFMSEFGIDLSGSGGDCAGGDCVGGAPPPTIAGAAGGSPPPRLDRNTLVLV